MQLFRKAQILTFPLLITMGAFAGNVYAQLTDIGLLPGGANCSGVAVNNAGTVVGVCDDADDHFVAVRKLSGQPIEELDTIAPEKFCRVIDINNSNEISGSCEDSNGEQHPVRWLANGDLEILNPIPGLLGLLGDLVAGGGAINSNGWVVGVSVGEDGELQPVVWSDGNTNPEVLPMGPLLDLGSLGCSPSDLNDQVEAAGGPVIIGTCSLNQGSVVRSIPVRWQRNGLGIYEITKLDPLVTNGSCGAVDINLDGDVVGNCSDVNGDSHAVVWNAGVTTVESIETDAPVGTTQTAAVAINDSGRIAGTFRASDDLAHAFMWNPNSDTFHDIGILPGGFGSVAVDISDSDDTVIGISQTSTGTVHAFRWRLTTGIIDLGTLGGFSSSVSDISDNGLIVGKSQIANGKRRAFTSP